MIVPRSQAFLRHMALRLNDLRSASPAPVPDQPKVLFLVAGLSVGGAERHTVTVRAALARRGFPTSLLAVGSRRSEVIAALPGAEDAEQLNVKGMSSLSGWVSLWRALRRSDANIVVCVNQAPLISAAFLRLAFGTRAKIVCVFHTTILRPSDRIRLPLFRIGLGLADALVYVSRNQASYWRTRWLWCRKQAVIQNGIDLDRFGADPAARVAMRQRLDVADDEILVGLIAAFRPEKNHAQLLDVVREAHDRGARVKVLFVGDGETRLSTERLARDLNLDSLVIFAGEQSDVRPWMSACDCGVLCSDAVETFSLAAIEFLASGVPMLMSDIGGASEIVEHGANGFLFTVGDSQAFADCLMKVSDPAIRERLRAQAARSVQGFSEERMVDGYVSLLHAVSAGSRQRFRQLAPGNGPLPVRSAD